jgi:endonuclease/exonuclease/phosphatase family metal-dependent hydrolase
MKDNNFNKYVPQLMLHPTQHLVLAGDFNCVINYTDSTRVPSKSRALQQLVQGLDIQDAWEGTGITRAYTHYTTAEATRIDRIYLSRHLIHTKKLRVAAFTDHLVVILHITQPTTVTTRVRGYWKLNPSLLLDRHTQTTFTHD